MVARWVVEFGLALGQAWFSTGEKLMGRSFSCREKSFGRSRRGRCSPAGWLFDNLVDQSQAERMIR